jgi:hypothetical protein
MRVHNTVIKEMYVKIHHHLKVTVRRKHPEKLAQKSWFLLHDKAPAHQSLVFPGFVSTQLFPVSVTNKCSKMTTIHG